MRLIRPYCVSSKDGFFDTQNDPVKGGEMTRYSFSWEERGMKKDGKKNTAKQRIIDNYEVQREKYLEEGYVEKQEIISVLKANIMALVTAGPFVLAGLLLWFTREREYQYWGFKGSVGFCVMFLLLIVVHEMLHGLGWSIFAKKRWKSMYFGVMWDSLTPYCHCKEPLRPGAYFFGGLLPFLVLGIGMYIAAWVSGSSIVWALSLFNILAAGGDITPMCMLVKYLGKNAVILDHPTECGFIAFERRTDGRENQTAVK